MKKFTVKLKPFSKVNRGGVAHNQVHQSEPHRQEMLDLIEDFQLFYNAVPQYHHKKKLPKTGADASQTQAWHVKQLTKNHAGRRAMTTHKLYEADVLRHNNLVESVLNSLDREGKSDAYLVKLIDTYWIDMEEHTKYNSATHFLKLVKFG